MAPRNDTSAAVVQLIVGDGDPRVGRIVLASCEKLAQIMREFSHRAGGT